METNDEKYKEIIYFHPELELDRIFLEFQLQDIEIVDNFVSILRKEYLRRWSSPGRYTYFAGFKERVFPRDQTEIMLKEVAIFAHRALHCKKEYPELAFIAYKKALKLFRKYLKSYAHDMQNYLLVEDPTGWYINRFTLNPYDPSKKEIERVINNMFLEIMKNQELFEEQGIKLRNLDELYADISHINHELTEQVKNRLFLQGSSNTLRNALLQDAGETMESLRKKEEHTKNLYHDLLEKMSWELLLISEGDRDFAKLKDPGSLIRRYHYAENPCNQSL